MAPLRGTPPTALLVGRCSDYTREPPRDAFPEDAGGRASAPPQYRRSTSPESKARPTAAGGGRPRCAGRPPVCLPFHASLPWIWFRCCSRKPTFTPRLWR